MTLVDTKTCAFSIKIPSLINRDKNIGKIFHYSLVSPASITNYSVFDCVLIKFHPQISFYFIIKLLLIKEHVILFI